MSNYTTTKRGLKMRKIYIYRSENENDVQGFFEKADEKLQSNFKRIQPTYQMRKIHFAGRM